MGFQGAGDQRQVRLLTRRFDCCLPWQGIREQARLMRAAVFMVSINDYICSHEWEQDRK